MSTTGASNSAICWPSKYWLKWVALFFGSLIVGGILALMRPKPPEDKKIIPPVPDKEIAITFEVYDSQGNPVNAVLFENGKENPGKKVTRVVGKPMDLYFKRKDAHSSDTPITEHVIWRAKADYIVWLDGDFKKKLDNLYPNHNQTKWVKIINSIKSDISNVDQRYPIVFPAH